MMRKSLSVIVITKNEEDRIARCLESVKSIADEIILLDSGSTDSTVEIAKTYTDKVYQTDWPGYGPQKQRALEKASCDWVLSIDADEVVDKKLAEKITLLLSKEKINENAFRLRWGTIFLGKRLRFGRAARAPKRLFKRQGARFTDAKVHEHIVTDGITGKIRAGYLLHYSHRDYNHLAQKTREYAWLGSQKYYSKNKKSNGLLIAILRGMLTFIQIYLLRLGLLDGNRGFLMACVFAQYTFNKYAGLWSLEKQPD